MDNSRSAVIFISNVIDSPIYRNIINLLLRNDWNVTYFFIGKETESLKNYTQSLGLKVVFYENVTKARLASYIFKNLNLIFRINPLITLTFGQTATIVGFSVAVLASKSTRIYLRMHTSMNKVEMYRFGTLYDRYSNFMANKIIVPNKNTKDYLIKEENVCADSIEIIEFGFELDDYKNLSDDRMRKFVSKYNLNHDFYYVGIASRFAPAKGLEYSIPAIARMIGENPKIKLIVAGIGEKVSDDFQLLLSKIPADNYLLIDRVHDMAAFYNSLDIFVHTPIDSTVESFGLVYVEAMATGVPCVFTLSGIAKDIAINEENCLVVDYKDEDSIYCAVKRFYNDSNMALQISNRSQLAVMDFDMKKMCSKYLSIFEMESKL
jgi:glycosyltransferase involved in cell wall biosynthesis